MPSINRAQIMGYLGRDPELRTLPSGQQVANFSIATTEKWKDKQSGDLKEKTEWHNCNAFGRTAEIVGEYLRKGALVYVEGRIQTRKWQDKHGNDRYSTEIVVNDLKMLGRPGNGGGQRREEDRPAENRQKEAPAKEDDDFDDDIPFSWAAVLPIGLMLAAAVNLGAKVLL